MKKLVFIFIPCYNEKASLLKLYEEIGKLMDTENCDDRELFFINNDSRDKAIDIF